MTVESAEVMMGAIQRRAMEIVALPIDKRETRYRLVYAAYKDSALKIGQNEAAAQETAAQMVEFTKALVRIIETGGGGSGGNA